jgi:hypothetical protein
VPASATAIANATELAELRARHGALTDDLAVFGTCAGAAGEPLPRWTTDVLEVRRRIARKAPDAVAIVCWDTVADLARHCHALTRPYAPTSERRAAVRAAVAAARDLARSLPRPPRALSTAAASTADDEWGPHVGAVEAAAAALCRAVDDPGWVDPEALAGWVADTTSALLAYRDGLRSGRPGAHLVPLVPPSRRPRHARRSPTRN